MNEHPLIAAMKVAGEQAQKVAGEQAQKVAQTLRNPHYGPRGIEGTGWLADALIEDLTGHSALNDRWTVEDRGSDPAARKAARERTEQRNKIALALYELTSDYRERLYREIAAGNAAKEAAALEAAANSLVSGALIGLRTKTSPVETAV